MRNKQETIEKSYQFRQRLNNVHRPNRRDAELQPDRGETPVGNGWSVFVPERCGAYLLRLAQDLQDYLLVSMNVSVYVRFAKNMREALRADRTIVLATADRLPDAGDGLTEPRSYRLIVGERNIVICGRDERGVGQGCYYVEDLMNLREAPFLRRQDIVRTPLFSPRMVHSGWGLDEYPDAHLNAIAHAGMDAILVFVKDVDHSPKGHLNFNDLIDRAERYGLDVYAYSYLESLKHPGDTDAEAYYDDTYGNIFSECPRFKGVILVGESVEFPSKDPNTTGQFRQKEPTPEMPSAKPSPGWWPCFDYPEWLEMLKRVIRKHNAQADIVFWTYNWGWAPEEARLELIRRLPPDITLLVTFEMFEPIRRHGVTNVAVDYTLSLAGPGAYFRSEAEEARKRGLTLYTMSNTAGLTWDFGVIPYEPMPFQWMRRYDALLRSKESWGLSGLMESHHYGFWPSFISDLAKHAFWRSEGSSAMPGEALAFARSTPEEGESGRLPSPPDLSLPGMCEALACRDYGREAAPLVIETWKCWSEAITHYAPTNEDQYGPFRIGPSYPMLFQHKVVLPAAWHAMFGSRIVHIDYKPSDYKVRELGYQSLGPSRIEAETISLERMEALLEEGLALLSEAIGRMPASKKEDGEALWRIGRFMQLSVRTTLHLKRWWKLKMRVLSEADPNVTEALLREMERLARAEIANAEAAVPLVEADSRLGWEPSMDYMTDATHLRWKSAQVEGVIEELRAYAKSLKLTDTYAGNKR